MKPYRPAHRSDPGQKFPRTYSREVVLNRLRASLERHGYPRLQMLLLVMVTGGVGFLCSFVMLEVGYDEMWLRYLTSVGVAYVAFLLLLWLWLRSGGDDYVDSIDIGDIPSTANAPAIDGWSGAGGQFGGGGASGHYDSDLASSHSGELLPSIGDVDIDVDEFAIPLALLALVGFVLLASLSIVYSAPALFAELLLDGVFAAALYRRLQRIDNRHWLQTALKRTWIAFLVTAIVLAVAGWGMNSYAPEARSIGDVLIHSRA